MTGEDVDLYAGNAKRYIDDLNRQPPTNEPPKVEYEKLNQAIQCFANLTEQYRKDLQTHKFRQDRLLGGFAALLLMNVCTAFAIYFYIFK